MLDMLPFPLGATILAMGLYQRAAAPPSKEEATASRDVLDAVLDD